MSGFLWKYYLEDDLESFLQVLDEASIGGRSSHQRPSVGIQAASYGNFVGSPGSFATSPGAAQSLKSPRPSLTAHKGSFHDISLTRADINRRDSKGRTLLHLAASSTSENGPHYACALVAHPLIDLYAQDAESGWTALHRAFYFGNITVARAIVERDNQDVVGEGGSGTSTQAGNLIRVKDHEGNAPYDILTETIQSRTLRHKRPSSKPISDQAFEEDDEESVMLDHPQNVKRHLYEPYWHHVFGDELFTFGSNRNNTLGLGNQDDRQFPERVSLKRPDHLYRRFHRKYVGSRSEETSQRNTVYSEKLRTQLSSSADVSSLPSLVQALPIYIRDVQMSKFSTAVLTADPVSNLFICGHGFGGRLGTGKETTEFRFVCIEDFGSSCKCIVNIALGQDHTLAVNEDGEVFSWGMNNFGQLGHGMSKVSVNAQEPVQLVPKQIFGPFKKEAIVGIAASRTHSVAHTRTSLYTFGKNDGQLGITDAGARSLEIQSTPRKVAASRFSSPIQSVCAIDRATICLLANQEVHVFTNYGVVKVAFPFPKFLVENILGSGQGSFSQNLIQRIAAGGDTICALAETGHVCAVTVQQRGEIGPPSTTSTTNPKQIKAALSDATCIWSPNRAYMAAKDIAVDQDGSIILATSAGTVWRRVRRAALPGKRADGNQNKKSKDYKFMKIPGLTRVTAVRASATGAYCAIRQDSDVTKDQIIVDQKTLWSDLFGLLPFKALAGHVNGNVKEDELVITERGNKSVHFTKLIDHMLQSTNLEIEMTEFLKSKLGMDNYNIEVGTTISEVRIPAHQFVLAARSRFLREGLANIQHMQKWSSDIFDMRYESGGKVSLIFHGLDFLTVCEFVLYVYVDSIAGFCSQTERDPVNAYRFRQVRLELMKLASKLELRALESAVRRMHWTPEHSMNLDYELAISDLSFFNSGDTIIQLEDGEIIVHSSLVSQRCPFFEVLFAGRAGGGWLSSRREGNDASEPILIDMKHIEAHIFRLVLIHLYADKGEELFENIVAKSLDDYLDVVLEVLSVANELMLDRLSQACQRVLGRHVNVRNVCQLLNAVAPCSVEEFKNAGLEYICHNLETMLTNHLLEELDEELLCALNEVVRDNQLSSLPFAKSGRAEAELHERHPGLAEILDRNRRAKVDSINLQAKFNDLGSTVAMSFDLGNDDEYSSRPRTRLRESTPSFTSNTPAFKAISPVMSPNEVRNPPIKNFSQSQDAGTSMSLGSPASPSNIGPLAVQLESASLASASPRTTRIDSKEPTPALKLSQVSTPTKSIPEISLPESSSSRSKAWAATTLPSTKLGIKEIMSQAANSRTSSISIGLASQKKDDEASITSFGARMSQKERRKHQQSQPLQSNENATKAPPAANTGSSSPWQAVRNKDKSGFKQDTSKPTLPQNNIGGGSGQRVSPAPQLTMRQTIANTPAVRQASSLTLTTPSKSQSQKRNVSSPSASGSPAGGPGFSSSASKPIEIKSIRHEPRPDTDLSPTFYMHQSMADIFSQQQAEKNIIKENTMKRSLQEIQQEQEFQQWWDQESKRVMEEEAAALAAAALSAKPRATASNGSRTHNTHGGGQRANKSRGKRKPSGKEKAAVEGSAQKQL